MKVAVLDIETSDLDLDIGSILEIGICLLDSKTGKTSKLFDSLVNDHFNPDKEKQAWIFSNSTLRPEMIINAPSLESKRTEIQAILSRYPVIAYNSSFDLDYLRSRRFEIPKELDDPMLICRDILRIPHHYFGWKYPKVQEAMEYFEIDGIEPHRAFEDSKFEAMIVFNLFKHGFYQESGK